MKKRERTRLDNGINNECAHCVVVHCCCTYIVRSGASFINANSREFDDEMLVSVQIFVFNLDVGPE